MSEDDLRGLILNEVRTIAVVGIKSGESDDAFRVPRYLQAQGYRIVPVSPKLATVLTERVFPSLLELDEPVDLVNLFRASDHIPAHVDEILAMPVRPKAVWMQLGIRHPQASARLLEAGIRVVEDRCLMVDHRNWTKASDPATVPRADG